MTVREALHGTMNMLNGISVPIGLQQQVAQPIAQAVGNLAEIIRVIDEGERKAEEEKPAVTEGDL